MKTPKTKLHNRQSVSCDIPLFTDDWRGELFIPRNQTYCLTVDYPVQDDLQFPVKSGPSGMTTMGLIKRIIKIYQMIYKSPSKYKIWGHSLDDLVLEGINVNHKTKVITLGVGS